MVNMAVIVTLLGLLLAQGLQGKPERKDAPPAGEGPRSGERGRLRGMAPFKPFLMAGHPDFARMVEAALARPEDVEKKLAQWPRYQEMNEAGRGELRQGFDRFRRRIREEALEDARGRGWNVPAEKEAVFLRSYWERRIRVEQAVREKAEAELKKTLDAALGELARDYSTPGP
jgi:hypothetical protein